MTEQTEATRLPRVLVVDDDPTARMVASTALSLDHVEVLEAKDGEEAVEIFAREKPDMVVLDVSMPGMSGFEVCGLIRTQLGARDTPVLLVTGLDDVESIDRAYEVGATDFVTKPVNWTIFVQRVRYMLRASHAFEEMDEARRAALASSQARIGFLARMSHEMRTPLTAVLGFLDLLDETRESAASAEERGEAVVTIRRNARHLLQLVDDVLDYSQSDVGRMQLRTEACQPAGVAREVVDALTPAARAAGLELELRVAKDAPEKIFSNPSRLRQVLTHLAANGIKFTERGSVTVEVRPRAWEDGVEYIVSDTGAGIPDDQLERLFDPFEQGDGSSTRAHEGAGLGLAIVKQLVEMLGGSIEVRSRPGEGSVFRVSIPTRPDAVEPSGGEDQAAEPRPAPGEGKKSAPGGAPRLTAGTRVLLVDDGVDNQRLIGRLLERAGAELGRAENGIEAVEAGLEAMAQSGMFDVILMDMQMPELDGYGATRQLRDAGYSAPILALTAHAVRGERERCLEAGCDDFLTKPVDRAGLIGAVSSWAKRGRAS